MALGHELDEVVGLPPDAIVGRECEILQQIENSHGICRYARVIAGDTLITLVVARSMGLLERNGHGSFDAPTWDFRGRGGSDIMWCKDTLHFRESRHSMCGIAGFVGGFQSGLSRRLLGLIEHRGPDGQGVWEDRRYGVTLCHSRLSILDLTQAAAQPMISADGRHILVFNGEIYNFRELRQGLESIGQRFKSTGDTEVLLRGLVLEGADFLGRLNGIFAIAFWDSQSREMLLARDPLGVKPLYYAEPSGGGLAFASEIKALFAMPGIPATPEFEVLLQHLAFCHASGDATAFRGIRRLSGGCALRWSASSGCRITQYWTARHGTELTNRTEALGQLREAIASAVTRQLVSDVPVGAFFSGGIDSTLLAVLGVPRLGNKFHCYTITYPSQQNMLDGAEEDGPYAARVAEQLGLSHIKWEIKPEVADLWPRLLYHLDEPIADPAAIGCFLISQLARNNHTKVLLSGQGADELFGGYPRYRVMNATGFSDYLPRSVRKAVAWAGSTLSGAREGRIGSGLRRIRRVLVSFDQDPDRRFMSYCANSPDDAILSVLSPQIRNQLGDRLPSDECLRHMDEVGLRGVDRWLERDLSVYLPNHNLLYTDKMSMAAGVETRVPLLDLELVKLVTAMPVEWKIRRGVTKAILRDAARGIVPDEVIDRPKAGFCAPYRKWLRYDLGEMWEDLTSESVVKRRGWFDHAALKRIRKVSQSGAEDLYMLQWAVLTLELWARQFIDRNPAKGT